MLTDLCAAQEKRPRDVSSMGKILYGAAPTPPALLRRGIKVFADAEFVGTYGSTEGAGGWFTKLTPDDHRRALEGKEELLSSCGRPMIHARLKVVDQEGDPCGAGEIGEICVSGGFLMDGYFREEELTRQAIRQGWLHTGDMGRIDEEGYVYLVDRKQFMIITGGYNVYPIEIENVIAEHPAVREVCVFGVPDVRWGEAIHAAVVVGDGETVGMEEIITWCRDKLPGFKVPKSVELRASLMRGATGKLLKRAELDRYLAG
jgi:acyl-CoA synthetase (AMP-forming)/AMP-acid ligase II